ncbi:helix-turn-helix domain-containing protein [Runella limosa]|uniref:helix-turn-helix domain-containing protein n=1 Tax=Runella limosa TaxID=370978 RepID=UPI000406D504|nr:helix-turn-helix transcriptional regulator [Runella limosa]
MTTTNFHIGLAIKLLAEKKKCSAETLAQRIGIVRQSVYDTYERETVRKSTVRKYADALGVSEDEIYKLAGFKADNVSHQGFTEDVNYLQRRLSDLEELVNFLKSQVVEKDKQINVLLGKSDSVFLARFVISPLFFGVLVTSLDTLHSATC